ncbi:MAG: helix-turn-helix transcriptional regulator [Acidobacteria bacterium]|nr:helix-turn-helix transcriptional regulator [Acidobacteriota bacterium]
MFAAPLDDQAAGDLAEIFKALADPTRLRLISLIASSPNAEACACDLAAPVGRSQPTVSHHLSQLVAAGLLEREQRGKWAWFRLDDDRVAAIADALTPAGSNA